MGSSFIVGGIGGLTRSYTQPEVDARPVSVDLLKVVNEVRTENEGSKTLQQMQDTMRSLTSRLTQPTGWLTRDSDEDRAGKYAVLAAHFIGLRNAGRKLSGLNLESVKEIPGDRLMVDWSYGTTHRGFDFTLKGGKARVIITQKADQATATVTASDGDGKYARLDAASMKLLFEYLEQKVPAKTWLTVKDAFEIEPFVRKDHSEYLHPVLERLDRATE